MKQLPTFTNQKLYEQAFIHRSFLNETKDKLASNERLEFLGDSVLSFIVSNYLYTTYPDFNEGMLTNLRALLVNTKILGQIAKELDFGSLMKLSRGEDEAKGRENISLLADCFEAFVGALFLDQGLETTISFIKEMLLDKAESFVQKKTLKDPKSLLQEYVQAKKQHTLAYKVLSEEGPAHEKTFTVGVFVQQVQVGVGVGKSKQEAEEKAANEALEKMAK